ncbi:MAG: hypothetical protein HQ522_13540 [Bacteroidetes bacterium]|nr:hypothetical protein [Bacteroidota bacterium]
MSKIIHKIYVFTLVAITVIVFLSLAFYGAGYYFTNIQERFFHEQNELLKPSGFIGHGMGITGSLLMIIGVFGYMARKRFRSLSRVGVLKYWLEFHIFLCTLGPILVLFHTSFKFGGIVAVSLWSMVAVVISGVLGRFIYIQIPRTIEGREMSLNELNGMKVNFYIELENRYNIDSDIIAWLNASLLDKSSLSEGNLLVRIFKRLRFENRIIRQLRSKLKAKDISRKNFKKIIKLIRGEIILSRRIAWLSTMQNYLRYWHVAHLPFALIMLVIMIVHVIVAVLFGYKWIF